MLFWRWINNSTVALVTDTAVFHWSIEGMHAHVCVTRLKIVQVSLSFSFLLDDCSDVVIVII